MMSFYNLLHEMLFLSFNDIKNRGIGIDHYDFAISQRPHKRLVLVEMAAPAPGLRRRGSTSQRASTLCE